MTVDIENLRHLLAEATPQPWESNQDGEVRHAGVLVAMTDALDHGRNAALIKAAVNALPELLAVFDAACRNLDVTDSFDGYISQELIDAVQAARGRTTP